MNNPILVCIGDNPGNDDDQCGEPFVGMAGKVLREVLRHTKHINQGTALITNVLGCKPKDNKFPKDECPKACVVNWLDKEIALAKPKRVLLLGSQALKYVAGMSGITSMRGNWINVNGIRTMPTYHPSYVMRQDNAGNMQVRRDFEADIAEMADEVEKIRNAQVQEVP